MRSFRALALLGTLAIVAVLTVGAPPAGAQGTVKCEGRTATIVGTAGDDVLRGTSGKDIIAGLAGDDLIYGLGGGDILCGGPGRDRIYGQAGKDIIIGAGSTDRLYGGPGDDIIEGDAGSDRMWGGRGNDRIVGGTGFDRFVGGLNNDECVIDTADVFQVECETGNYKRFTGNGDRLVRPRLTDSYVVSEHCFPFVNTCDKFYVARVKLDGAGTVDSLGVTAFTISGNPIATYGAAGDRYTGVFLFSEKPQRIEVDSGGGAWEITFVERSGVRVGAPNTSGVGNQVYTVKRPVQSGEVTATANWNGFGHFAVVTVSPGGGRELAVNEVRFPGQDAAPFQKQSASRPGVSLVQVLSEGGSWTVELSN